MRRFALPLLALLPPAAACAAPERAGIPPAERRYLDREYAKCADEADVSVLREFFLTAFPEEEAAFRARQFEEWREEQIARVFGPKPEARGTCERHGLPLVAGIANTEFGLPVNSIRYVQDHGAADAAAVRILVDPPRLEPTPLHPKRGAQLGCRRDSAFSWTIYCPECEAEAEALRDFAGP